jgi:CBS domain-containing protein
MKEPVSAILGEKGRQVHTTSPDATVAEAVEAMNQARIGSLIVLEGERPIGIFTERDVLVRVVAEGRESRATRIAEVMTREPVVISPDTTIEEAMVIVTEKRCRHLPVLDGDRLVGMVSIGDLTRWLVRDQRHRIKDLVHYITGSPVSS